MTRRRIFVQRVATRRGRATSRWQAGVWMAGSFLLLSACGESRDGKGSYPETSGEAGNRASLTEDTVGPVREPQARPVTERTPFTFPDHVTVEFKVERVCGQCHGVPDPNALDRNSWERSVLPMMGWRLGIYEPDVPRETILAGAVDPDRVRRENRFPEHALLDEESWEEIRTWYLDRAPDMVERPVELTDGLHERESWRPSEQTLHWADPLPPALTLLEIDTERSLIYAGGTRGDQGELLVLDRTWQPLQRIPLPSAPVHLERAEPHLLVTLIGTLRLQPRNNRKGELVQLVRGEGERLFEGLQGFAGALSRPVQTLRADLTGNGEQDLVVAEFGFYSGSVTLFEHRTDRVAAGAGQSPYERRELYSEPGAVKMQWADLNGDGRNELVVLMAQGDEGVVRFRSDSDGEFHPEWLLRFHPGWGATDLIATDMTGNGRVDLVVCNGDNGDFPPVLRADHGIRIYENRGENEFEEVYWHPMDGAYRCRLTGRNERELVAVSYFPDESRTPRGDLLLLRYRGDGEAEVREWPVNLPARWLALAAAPLAPGEPTTFLAGSHGELTTNESFDEALLRRRLAVMEWR